MKTMARNHAGAGKKKTYLRFAAMIATSTVLMLVLMYLNTYAWEHVFFSETRVYMALVMGAAMALVMLAWMHSMYPDRRANIAIVVAAVLGFALFLWLVRSQVTVSGTSYMRAMIPHHSIAIMTSERAGIGDARVRKLADEIIEAQRREIAEMRYLIAHAEEGGAEQSVYRDPPPVRGSIADAVNRALISTLDAAPMSRAEADQVLAEGRHCRFLRSAQGDPVLWVASDGRSAAMKLNGVLVGLNAGAGVATNQRAFSTDGASVAVTLLENAASAADRQQADLVLALSQGLSVGYRGYWSCE